MHCLPSVSDYELALMSHEGDYEHEVSSFTERARTGIGRVLGEHLRADRSNRIALAICERLVLNAMAEGRDLGL